jgi:tRNA pseudouridine55 synthase
VPGGEDLDVIFNVHKPKGLTSHDVVARLRRASGVRRIGHAGTLDPMAEGVLVIAMGRATRVVEYLAGTDKAYRAQITFGVETDTYDAEGNATVQRPVHHLTRDAVNAALSEFRGVIQQRAPAYSAISVGGRRLYDLARRGQHVEPPVRTVTILALELLDWTSPVATIQVECSKGTYIRSLAHDLGQAVGTGAHLSALTRTRVGHFHTSSSVPLADLEAQMRDRRARPLGILPDQALPDLPEVRLEPSGARRISHGMAVLDVPISGALDDTGGATQHPLGTLARMYGPDGAFLAICRLEEMDGRLAWRPEKVFT